MMLWQRQSIFSIYLENSMKNTKNLNYHFFLSSQCSFSSNHWNLFLFLSTAAVVSAAVAATPMILSHRPTLHPRTIDSYHSPARFLALLQWCQPYWVSQRPPSSQYPFSSVPDAYAAATKSYTPTTPSHSSRRVDQRPFARPADNRRIISKNRHRRQHRNRCPAHCSHHPNRCRRHRNRVRIPSTRRKTKSQPKLLVM